MTESEQRGKKRRRGKPKEKRDATDGGKETLCLLRLVEKSKIWKVAIVLISLS